MTTKKLLNQHKKRQLPTQYSWIDQRFVRDQHIYRCTPDASALYLFLLTVGDKEGLSYYSDPSVSRYISMNKQRLACARDTLIKGHLIAYEKPHYQVLMLSKYQPIDSSPSKTKKTAHKKVPNEKGEWVSVGKLLRDAYNKSEG